MMELVIICVLVMGSNLDFWVEYKISSFKLLEILDSLALAFIVLQLLNHFVCVCDVHVWYVCVWICIIWGTSILLFNTYCFFAFGNEGLGLRRFFCVQQSHRLIIMKVSLKDCL